MIEICRLRRKSIKTDVTAISTRGKANHTGSCTRGSNASLKDNLALTSIVGNSCLVRNVAPEDYYI